MRRTPAPTATLLFLPKTGWAIAHSAHPPVTPLYIDTTVDNYVDKRMKIPFSLKMPLDLSGPTKSNIALIFGAILGKVII